MAVLDPPVALALARGERRLPAPDERWAYEPKFDGWRAAAFTRSGFLQSRNGNDLARRFPEIVAAVRRLGDLVLDGELVALRDGRLDFGALPMPARAREAAGVTVYFIAFDLLADADRDWRAEPYRARRDRLEQVLGGGVPPVQLVPVTTDQESALAWLDPAVAQVGIEGVLVKDRDGPYRAGRTDTWRKVRQQVVVDAVVIGVTGPPNHPEAVVLARPDAAGELTPIGLSMPMPTVLREAVGRHTTPTGGPTQILYSGVLGHPGTEYLPVEPTLVVEVEAEAAVETFANRLRPTVHRLRPDF